MPPVVSMITVCHNSAAYLQQTVDSVLSQRDVEVEYIIIDGASTDGTVDIIKSAAPRLAYWCSEEDEGMYQALNKGLARCTGEIVGIVNSDDLLFDDLTLAKVASVFSEFPDVDGVYGDQVQETPRGERYKKVFQVTYEDYLLSGKGTFVPHGSLFLRRDFLERLGGYDERYRYAGDYDLILRALQSGTLKYWPSPLSRFRVHDASITASGRLPSERDAILQAHGLHRYPGGRRFRRGLALWTRYRLLRLLSLVGWPIIRRMPKRLDAA
jgi:glycosyltransferase involved in cell wall biosynthesis